MNSSRRAVSMPDSCRANSSADTPIVWHAWSWVLCPVIASATELFRLPDL